MIVLNNIHTYHPQTRRKLISTISGISTVLTDIEDNSLSAHSEGIINMELYLNYPSFGTELRRNIVSAASAPIQFAMCLQISQGKPIEHLECPDFAK